MTEFQDFEVAEEAFGNVLIGFHLKCMRSFGYIVSKGQQHKSFHLKKCAIFVASFPVFCCFLFIKYSRGLDSLAQDAPGCSVAFTLLSFSIAISNAFFQRKRVVRMITFLHEDITELFRITDKEEQILLAETLKYLRVIMILIYGPITLASIIMVMDCLYRTTFKPETVFNVPEIRNGTAQPILMFQLLPFGQVYDNFIIGYLGPFYVLFLTFITIPVWHTFVVYLMKYIVLKYAIISKRIKEYNFSKFSSELRHEDLKFLPKKDLQYWHTRMCGFCIREQTNLRWFTKELESLIAIPAFMDFIIFSVLICFILYAATTGEPSNMQCVFYVNFLFACVFMMWMYHFHATLVMESNEELRFALYCSPWYTFPVNIQKSILLMMTETAKPLIINALFVELNLKTFVDILRGAYSYFSLLRNSGLEQ